MNPVNANNHFIYGPAPNGAASPRGPKDMLLEQAALLRRQAASARVTADGYETRTIPSLRRQAEEFDQQAAVHEAAAAKL